MKKFWFENFFWYQIRENFKNTGCTFLSSFFALNTLIVILPGATASSSATISTDLIDGARLGSLEAGLDDALEAGLEEMTDGGLEESLESAARHWTDT